MREDAEIVGMANQIASFFSSYPDAEAIEGIAGHIRDFWDPRMRAQLNACLADGAAGFNPLTLSAARLLASEPL